MSGGTSNAAGRAHQMPAGTGAAASAEPFPAVRAPWPQIQLFCPTLPCSGSLPDQLAQLRPGLAQACHSGQWKPLFQTVFLRHSTDQLACEQFLAELQGHAQPPTQYLLQPPAAGQALAVELWMAPAKNAHLQRLDCHTLLAQCPQHTQQDWVFCVGVTARPQACGLYAQAIDAFSQMQLSLQSAGCSFEQVVRAWFCLGSITGQEAHRQRYSEFNRARSDFYQNFHFHTQARLGQLPYPASTGIGMAGDRLTLSCLALKTGSATSPSRLAIENPDQVPAYSYGAAYSAQSPKFSRALALWTPSESTFFVSGTASILGSESRHPGNVEAQTNLTLDNIDRLLSPANLSRHELRFEPAGLAALKQIRVYLKHAQDWPLCQAICQHRLGKVPAVYLLADICRPELLVEIEGVAQVSRA